MKFNTIASYSFLFLLVLFSSCKNEEKDTPNTETASEAPIVNETETQVFEGQIDGQHDIIMELNLEQNSIRGELIYKSVGVPILIEGSLNNNFLEVKEIINGAGNAKIAGKFNNGVYEGIWVKSGSSEKLPMSMKASDSDFRSFINEDKMHEIKITGTYEMPEEEGVNSNSEIRLNYTKNGEVEFSLIGIGSAPSYNQGFLSGIAQYQNNEITYTDQEMKGCSFTINFTSLGLEISCEDDKCGFGANVRLSGAYQKTSYEKPEINFN